MMERLQKIMASRGICSRRAAEKLIVGGNVKVDGTIIRELGTKVATDATIELIGEGAALNTPTTKQTPIYILMHKPVGYITSTTSKQGDSVMELLTEQQYVSGGAKAAAAWEAVKHARVFPVGRLDKDSEGLILLTNDGALANTMTHPKYEHEKEYEVTITGRVPKGAEEVLARGMDIGEGEHAQGIQVKNIKTIGKRTIITIILKEGKNRQIRRMFGRLGMDVLALKRTRIGTYKLNTLPVGKWVRISK